MTDFEEYISIHRRLFIGIYKFARKIRDYNITKAEWVLDGEGNTRTTAVFTIKYLCTFGLKVENTPFAQNSWYFRNALVRANYNNYEKNVYATMKYLNRFFENLLFGGNNILKNRELHIHFVAPENTPNKLEVNDTNKLGVNKNTPNLLGVNRAEMLGVKLNKNQLKMLELIEVNNKITIIETAEALSISETAVENNIKKLREKGIISRVGSDKTGHWKILEEGGNQ